MDNEFEVIESIATKIRYQEKIWIPESDKKIKSDSLSSEKIRCWLRFKEIGQFSLDDLRSAFPEWNRYAKSQLTFKLNPLVINKTIQQLQDDNFRVLKL